MIVSPKRVLRRKLNADAFLSTFWIVNSAIKAPPFEKLSDYSKCPSFSIWRRKVGIWSMRL